MRLYWLGLSSFVKFLHLAVAIALLVMLFFWLMGSPAHADGYGPSQKDEIRESRYSAPRDDIRKYLTAADKRELRRIHSRAVARRDERVFRSASKNLRVAARYDEPTRIRYVERRNAPESLYSRVDGKRCHPAIKAVSEERGWEARALRDAISKWRAAAIAEHGYAYGHYNSAKADKPDCGAIRTNKFGKDIYVCIVRARPCKDL